MTPSKLVSTWTNRELLVAHRLLVRANSAQVWAARDVILQTIRLAAFDRMLAVL